MNKNFVQFSQFLTVSIGDLVNGKWINGKSFQLEPFWGFLSIESPNLQTGNWKLEIGNWKLEIVNRKSTRMKYDGTCTAAMMKCNESEINQ